MQSELLGDELYSKLAGIAEHMKDNFSIFPMRCCDYASEMVRKATSLEIAWGYIINKDGKGEEHYWNCSPELGLIVDLTARQFYPELDIVHILCDNTPEAEELYCELGNTRDIV